MRLRGRFRSAARQLQNFASPQMNDTAPHKSKKRKHNAPIADEPALKKHKRDKESSKSKGKARATYDDEDTPAEFRTFDAHTTISIPPAAALDPLASANEMLDSMLMRWDYH
jgi:hypothetical protein